MRVSRTRFSKRRVKRKTEFPIVAVVQKKRKVESTKSLSFGIVNNQAEATKQQKKTSSYKSTIGKKADGSKSSIFMRGTEKQNSAQLLTEEGVKGSGPISPGSEPKSDFTGYENKNVGTPYPSTEQKESRLTQKNIASKPPKKSRATIDYKNVILLRNLITAEGKILPRRINKLTAKQQRNVQKAIKSARIMGLIPFINKSRPF